MSGSARRLDCLTIWRMLLAYVCCLAGQVVKKAKLTKIVFNPKWPVVLVGDDKGCVTSLKLSPNLRKRCIPEKGQKVRIQAPPLPLNTHTHTQTHTFNACECP